VKKSASGRSESPSQLIDARIKALGDWRGKTLSRVRALIKDADPEVVEEIKWRKPTNPAGVPVWSHAGIICTGETYKTSVRFTFARGALLKDSKGLFNASLKGNALRAIVIHEGEEMDERAFKTLVRAAVALNVSRARERERE
jgi:hypothetical protein